MREGLREKIRTAQERILLVTHPSDPRDLVRHCGMSLHPLIEAAAHGQLPGWAEAGEARREHMARVAAVLKAWADPLALDETERHRWMAAGYLHDALRDASPESLRPKVVPELDDLAGPILHGPAAAERLRIEGVEDGDFLAAVAFHTLGHPMLGRLGRALYAADFLEPGRPFRPEWRAELRERLPTDVDGVVREIVAARIAHVVERRLDLLPQTVAFWNALARPA